MANWQDYYQKVLDNPTATPEAKTEAQQKLNISQPAESKDFSSLEKTMEKPAAGTGGTLSNLRLAMRAALTEASQRKYAARMGEAAPLMQGGAAPDVIKAAISLGQSGLRQTQESIFSDIMEGYKEADALKRKELDKINEIRLEFGSAIPGNVTDLKTAIDLASPFIDKKNKLEQQEIRARISKMEQDQSQENDIESWASDVADDPNYIAKVPIGIRTKVKVRAEEIKKEREGEMDKELRENIKFDLENKKNDYNSLRETVINGGSVGNIDLSALSADERRTYLDYVDQLEKEEKEKKKQINKKNLFGLGEIPFNERRQPTTNIQTRITELKQTDPKISRDRLEAQLLKDGYNLNDIRKELPFWNAPIMKLIKK